MQPVAPSRPIRRRSLPRTSRSRRRPPRPTSPPRLAKRYTYTPRVYPVDERGFSPVDKALAKAYAREDMVTDDDEGSLNPYVLKVISAYPLDGSYPYHCGWTPARIRHLQRRHAGPVVQGHGRRQGLSGRLALQLLLRVHVRGLRPRHEAAQHPEGPRPGRLQRHDLQRPLQHAPALVYRGRRATPSSGASLPTASATPSPTWRRCSPGDFLSYSTTPPGGHSVIFIDWMRDEQNKIVGFKYFSSNLSGTHGVGYGSGRFSDSNANGRGILRKSLRIAPRRAPSRTTSPSTARTFRSATPTRPRSRSASSTCRRPRTTNAPAAGN